MHSVSTAAVTSPSSLATILLVSATPTLSPMHSCKLSSATT
jgi:hypothetical protein